MPGFKVSPESQSHLKEAEPDHIDPSSYLAARETPASSARVKSAGAHQTHHEAFVFCILPGEGGCPGLGRLAHGCPEPSMAAQSSLSLLHNNGFAADRV